VAWTSKSDTQPQAETNEPRWKHRGFSFEDGLPFHLIKPGLDPGIRCVAA